MTGTKSFKDLSAKELAPSVVSIAGGANDAVLSCAQASLQAGYIHRVIIAGPVGDIRQRLNDLDADHSFYDILNAGSSLEAAELAVAAVSNGSADILMKGHIESATFLKCILDKRFGIRKSKVLSNITLFELDTYHKLLGITDNVMVPNPTLKDKRAFIENSKPLYAALGIKPIKVGLVAAAEKLSDALPSTFDAINLRTACEMQELPGFIIDGPFGYDACIDKEAADSKNLGNSSVTGDPDLIVFHDLETANAVGKAIKFHGKAKSGGLLLGAKVPITFNSRSDSAERRINSLLLACVISASRTNN
jgi:phosphate butyryltransferase